ncbi:MAG: ATP-dependent helicase [Coriobacteriales bacterium]|jgi:DNA helicase-2/ATP-dependent DNA helicase PcrA
MERTAELEQSFERLNPEQRQAVEHMDGPLLVIAGPGTGKTQLLSLRAANILLNRDVAPRNILCLTYTEAGAIAMKKRLVGLIGRDAYGIEVSTFHGFASGLRSRFPEYFKRGASAELISSLHKSEIIDSLLRRLPPSSPIFGSVTQEGVHSGLRNAITFIDNFKKSGLTPDSFRAIMHQTLGFLDYLEENTDILELVSQRIPGKAAEKEGFVETVRSSIAHACTFAPDEFKEPVISTPGIYVPYARHLLARVTDAEFLDEDGKTTGYGDFRDAFFEGTARDGKSFKDRKACEKALAIIDIYEEYAQALAEENLYDFDDMIADAIEAVQSSPELQQKLQDQYRYIQVDEFQDTNGSQLRIVELLTEGIDAPNIMAVGDDDQAIMRFQGASVACIGQFKDLYSPTYVVLKTNYRSTPAIVELGKEIAEQVEKRLPESATDKDVQAFRQDNEQEEFTARVFDSQDIELSAIARDIRERIDAGFIGACDKPEEAIAIISPKHKSLGALIPYLHEYNIPFSYRHTSNVFEMETMQTLLALMRCVVELARGRESYAEAQLPQIVSSAEVGVDHEACVRFSLHAKRNHHRRWLRAFEDCGDGRLEQLHERIVDWAGAAWSSPVRELIFKMSRPIEAYYREQSESDPLKLAEFNAGIRAILAFVQGELTGGRKLDRAMRLPDVVDRMDEAARFKETIDASIALGREDAVKLVSAHGSKGLEYDLVYLLDADDDTWHRGAAGTSFFASNMLIGDTKDEDDARRLLFVAVTRAKRLLEVYHAKNNIVRELQGFVGEEPAQVNADELRQIIQIDWTSFFELDTPELVSLLAPDLSKMELSASALNDFVAYEEGCANSTAFPGKRMIRLPQPPNINMEFGTNVHAYLEDYVNHVRGGSADPDELAARFRSIISWMDYTEEETEAYSRRFDRVVESFVPWFIGGLNRRVVTEADIHALSPSGVPLQGKCDLLLIDDDARTIDVADYKTGFNYPTGSPDIGYERQLQFYKLLIENSPEYAGYTVVSGVDYYVEPEKGAEGAIHEPVRATIERSKIEHLSRLIDAVWDRIQTGAFDTSAFETSEEFAAAVAADVNKDGSPKKRRTKKVFQAAYEQWLINTHRS